MTIVERGWRCLNIGCPTREPVRAEAPPKCYTCDRPMAEVHYPVTEKEIGRLAAAIDGELLTGGAVTAEEVARSRFVNLGTNPTAEQVRAAGFETNSAAYAEALATFKSEPDDLPTALSDRQIQRLTKPLNFMQQGCAADARKRGERVHREVERYLRERSLSNPFPTEQRPVQMTSVGIDDRGELSARLAEREIERLRVGDPVSVGYEVETERAYRCTRAGCPTREPVRASSPPTCYTCSQPMAMVDEFTRPEIVPGVAELIESMQRRIAAAIADSGMPTSILLGTHPSRLSATGEWFLPTDVGVPYFDRITGYRSEFNQHPMPRDQEQIVGVTAHDRLGEPRARKWEFKYRDLHVARTPHPLRGVTVQFGGAVLRNAHFEQQDLFVPSGSYPAQTWTLTAGVEGSDTVAIAAMRDVHGTASTLMVDDVVLCQWAVMTDLQVAGGGPDAWKITVKFQEIRTAVRYEHTLALPSGDSQKTP